MTANSNPIFTITPQLSFVQLTTATSSTVGTDTTNTLVVFTAGANGGFVQKLIFQPLSTSGSTTTSAAAARIYINNGSAQSTATNNNLFREISLGAITVNTAATTASFGYEFPINFQFAAGYQILVGITAFASNTQWNVQAVGGSY